MRSVMSLCHIHNESLTESYQGDLVTLSDIRIALSQSLQ